MSPKKKTSNTILYYLNRPLGAADGTIRLTVTEKNNNRTTTTTNGCCCWAVPLTLSNLEREIASTFSRRKISVLEVLIQTSSSGAAAVSEDDWKRIGASLQRYGCNIRTAHFLSCSDRDRSLILKHWMMSGHCSRTSTSNPKRQTTNNLNSVHIRDSPNDSSYERTFRVLASSASSSSTIGAFLSLRELVLCRGPGITDSEALHLWTVFGRLERFVLQEAKFVNDATWWRFFEWAENNSAAAITWDEPTGTATVNAAAAAASNHNPNSSNPPPQPQQQQQQQPLQDYIDWNCRLHSWRLHWLERWRVAQRIQRPSRSAAAASSSTDNDGNDNHDVTEIVQAACTVLKEWYRATHRPPVGQPNKKQIPQKEKSSTSITPASDGFVEATAVSSPFASSSCVGRQAVAQVSSSL